MYKSHLDFQIRSAAKTPHTTAAWCIVYLSPLFFAPVREVRSFASPVVTSAVISPLSTSPSPACIGGREANKSRQQVGGRYLVRRPTAVGQKLMTRIRLHGDDARCVCTAFSHSVTSQLRSLHVYECLPAAAFIY